MSISVKIGDIHWYHRTYFNGLCVTEATNILQNWHQGFMVISINGPVQVKNHWRHTYLIRKIIVRGELNNCDTSKLDLFTKIVYCLKSLTTLIILRCCLNTSVIKPWQVAVRYPLRNIGFISKRNKANERLLWRQQECLISFTLKHSC